MATAGLVLASLPLITAAIEQYRDLKKEGPLGAPANGFLFLRKRYELDKFYKALDEQRVHLRLSLIELFGHDDSRLTFTQRAALQDDADDLAALWTDENLLAAVKERLGLVYEPYMANIDKMKVALEKLLNHKCLHLQDAPGQASLHGLIRANATAGSMGGGKGKGITKQWTAQEIADRVRFSSQERRRLRLLRDIDECNEKLQRLMTQAHRVAPIMRTWRRRMTDKHHAVRAYAESLFRSLTASCLCVCMPRHEANLALPTFPLDRKGMDTLANFSFHMVVVSKAEAAGTWTWQEIDIFVQEHLQSHSQDQKSYVTFKPEVVAPSHGLLPRSPCPTPTPKLETSQLEKLQCICETISMFGSGEDRLSFALDDADGLYGPFTPIHYEPTGSEIDTRVGSIAARNMVTLNSLLGYHQPQQGGIDIVVPTSADDLYRLSKRERLGLAAKLASSVLQLHSTPWIWPRWTKKDIYFLNMSSLPTAKKEGESKSSFAAATRAAPWAARPVDAEMPFLSRLLDHPLSGQENDEETESLDDSGGKANVRAMGTEIGTHNPRHQCPILFDLGVLLLELYFGRPIESRLRPIDGDQHGSMPSSGDLLVAAREWLDECYFTDLSERYGSAVKHCINIWAFDPRPERPDLLDISFREAVYEKIAYPLEVEYREFCGIKPRLHDLSIR